MARGVPSVLSQRPRKQQRPHVRRGPYSGRGKGRPPEDKLERARKADGKFIADDPSTPSRNEAYVGGQVPTFKKWMRKDQLLEIAQGMGLEVSSENTKAQIFAALKNA